METPSPTTFGERVAALRFSVHGALFGGTRRGVSSGRVEQALALLIVLSVLSIAVEHVAPLHEPIREELAAFDRFTMLVFTAEYVLRLWTGGLERRYRSRSRPTLHYAVSPMALLDLVVILPAFLPLGGMVDLRFLRLARLLKLLRFLGPIRSEFRRLNKGRTFRQKVYSAFNPDVRSGRMGDLVDVVFGKLIFVSVIAVMLETVQSVHELLARELHYLDMFVVAVFTVEYAARLYACVEDPAYAEPVRGRLRYMLRPVVLIDLIAILPFYLSMFMTADLRFLRAVRLLRLLKFTRYSPAMSTLTEVFREQLPALGAAFFITMVVTVFSAGAFYLAEHPAQPDKITSIPEATYWAIITLLSVGYGDIYPVTPFGQFLTMAIALVGLGLVALPTGILASGFSQKMRERSDAFKALVDAKVSDGRLTPRDRVELKLKAEQLGLGHYREKELEQMELEAYARLAATKPFGAGQGETPPSDVLPYSGLEQLFQATDRLPSAEKVRLIARLAADLERTARRGEPTSGQHPDKAKNHEIET